MVRRLFVSGISSYTTEDTLRRHFQQFGELYECCVPPPPRYSAVDTGPDNEEVDARSSIRYEPAGKDEILDEELEIEPYNAEKHENFEKYMRKVGEGEAFTVGPRKTSAGYAYITFVTREGQLQCLKEEVHVIDRVKCTVELAKEETDSTLRIESKRLFVSFFPLDRLTSRELKASFGAYGKITDVEFVSDSEGPLHFCIITFSDSKSVDVIVTKNIFIRDVQVFTRRAVLREAFKIAEIKRKQAEAQSSRLPPNHTAYPNARFSAAGPSSSSSSTARPQLYDPSAAAGYAPLHRQSLPPPPDSDPHSMYGYGPRKW